MSGNFPPAYTRDTPSTWTWLANWAWSRWHSLVKYIYHFLFGTSELQRLLDQTSPSVTDIIFAIRNSKQLADVQRSIHQRDPEFLQIEKEIIDTKLGGLSKVSLTVANQLATVIEYLERLAELRRNVFDLADTKYDTSNQEHEKKLEELWQYLKPDVRRNGGRITKEWEEIGFQGTDPATDFRAMGVLGLESLLAFSRDYPASAQWTLINAQFPLAITGIKMAGLICEWLRDGSVDIHFVHNGSDIKQYNKLFSALIFAFATFYNSKKPKNLMDFPPIWNAYCNHVGGALATGVPLFDTMKRQWNLEPVLLEEKS